MNECKKSTPTLKLLQESPIGVRLLIFGLFSRGYVLLREGNAYFFFKISAIWATFIPESRVCVLLIISKRD